MRKKGGLSKKWHLVAEVAGWLGAGSILLAYVLALFGVITGDGFLYAFLNLAGAVGIIIIAAAKGVIQSVVLNTIWAIVALAAIIMLWLK